MTTHHVRPRHLLTTVAMEPSKPEEEFILSSYLCFFPTKSKLYTGYFAANSRICMVKSDI